MRVPSTILPALAASRALAAFRLRKELFPTTATLGSSGRGREGSRVGACARTELGSARLSPLCSSSAGAVSSLLKGFFSLPLPVV